MLPTYSEPSPVVLRQPRLFSLTYPMLPTYSEPLPLMLSRLLSVLANPHHPSPPPYQIIWTTYLPVVLTSTLSLSSVKRIGWILTEYQGSPTHWYNVWNLYRTLPHRRTRNPHLMLKPIWTHLLPLHLWTHGSSPDIPPVANFVLYEPHSHLKNGYYPTPRTSCKYKGRTH